MNRSQSTNWPQPTEMILGKPSSIKNVCYTFESFDKGDMHLYANFDQNIPCVFKSYKHFHFLTTEGRTRSHSDYSAHPRVVQFATLQVSQLHE